MPRQDATEPMGNGPMSGRRMGRCVGEKSPNHNRFGRFGFEGRGTRRFGMMNSRNDSDSFVDLITDLKDQIKSLKDEISNLKKNSTNE